MSKIIRTICLLFTVIALISACQTAEAEIVPEFASEYEGSDFNGLKLSFLCDSEKFFGYEKDTASYDALSKRIKEVEKKYNCKISYSSNTNIATFLPSATAAGDPLCDVLYIDDLPFRNLAAGGYLLDLSGYSDIIDVNDSFRWGTKNVLELCAYGGHLYGVTPAAWVDKLAPYYFFLVTNNDMLKTNGFSHPHEYYENGTWNRTVFEEIVNRCADTDKGIYGIDTSSEYIGRMAVYSDGIGLIDETSETPRSSWHSELVKDDLQWAYDFVTANKQYITQGGESYDRFIEGNSAMALTAIHHFCRKIIYTSAMSEYSVMPFPCSDAVEPGTCGGFFSTGLDTIAMPSLTTNEIESATVINEIWAPMAGCETQELLDAYYISNVFFSATDLEIFKKCMTNIRYNYWVEKVFDPLGSIISTVVNGKYTPSQAIDTYIETADELINRIVVPNEEGLRDYFSN